MSQTAKTRMKIDHVLREIAQSSNVLPQLLLMIEGPAHQRELQYRQEKEAREGKLEEDRTRTRGTRSDTRC
jgi:hypothetical protein